MESASFFHLITTRRKSRLVPACFFNTCQPPFSEQKGGKKKKGFLWQELNKFVFILFIIIGYKLWLTIYGKEYCVFFFPLFSDINFPFKISFEI